MNRKLQINIGLGLCMLHNLFHLQAQELTFSQVEENTFTAIQGDLELIGNNIVSIKR